MNPLSAAVYYPGARGLIQSSGAPARPDAGQALSVHSAPRFAGTNAIPDQNIIALLNWIGEWVPDFPPIGRQHYLLLKRALVLPVFEPNPSLNNDCLEFLGDRVLNLAVQTAFGMHYAIRNRNNAVELQRLKNNNFWKTTSLAEILIQANPALRMQERHNIYGQSRPGALCEAFLAALYLSTPGTVDERLGLLTSLVYQIIKATGEPKYLQPGQTNVLSYIGKEFLGRHVMDLMLATACYQQLPDRPVQQLSKVFDECRQQYQKILLTALAARNLQQENINPTEKVSSDLSGLGQLYAERYLEATRHILEPVIAGNVSAQVKKLNDQQQREAEQADMPAFKWPPRKVKHH